MNVQESAALLAACAASVQSLYLELHLASVRIQRGGGTTKKPPGLELYCKTSEECLWTSVEQHLFCCCFKNNLNLSQ